MMTSVIEREWIGETKPTWPPDVMPPMDVVKCQCEESCIISGPCELEATQDDMLCNPCREAIERINAYKEAFSGEVFSPSVLGRMIARQKARHCHECDDEFDRDEDLDGDSPR